MKKSLALTVSLILIITALFSACKKKEVPQTSSKAPEKEYLNASSSIAKTETDGDFTLAFDPYVLPQDVKEAIGGTLYYNRLVNAIVNQKDSVSVPSREVYDNIRFALGENFPFSILVKNLRYNSENKEVMISYSYENTHDEKIAEFKNAVGDVFDECVVNSDDDVLATMSLYKWICENISIVKDGAPQKDDNTVETSSLIAQTEDEIENNTAETETVKTDIFSTLIKKEGTDESVAALFNFLVMQIGVEGKSVSAWENDKTYRTWNLIKLDDKWYHCDVEKEQKATDGAGLKYFGQTQERVSEYIKSDKMFIGEWNWFTSTPPKSNSNRFKDFSKVSSWEIDASRKQIRAYTEEFNHFVWEI